MGWHDRPSEWVGDWSARRAALSPDRVALVDEATGERYTYAELDRRANRAARLLRRHGVETPDRPGSAVAGTETVGEDGEKSGATDGEKSGATDGDVSGYGHDDAGRVAVVSRNRPAVFDLFFATGKTGGILAPISHRLARRELAALLALVDPALLVVEEPFLTDVDAALADAGVDPTLLRLPVADGADATPAAPESEGFDEAEGSDEAETDLHAASTYEDALPDGPKASEPVDPAPVALDDPHLLLHTGGSTGTPKETVITHGSIAWNSLNTIASWGLRPDDVTPMVFPTFHTGGWNVITIPLFHLGGTVLIDREVDPGRVLAAIEREGATVLVAVPAVLRMLAEHDRWADTDLSSLRFVKSGGGPAREPVIRAWRSRGVDLSQGYGLTECGPNNFAMPDDWPDEKVDSVGRPCLHVDARIVDEAGAELPPGEVGELELAGPHAAAGYWRNPAETEATFGTTAGTATGTTVSDGDAERDESGGRWVSTGDLARVDEAGFFHIEGRKKHLFVSGGENVYPPVVEDAIAEHPAVADAIVIPIPHERWGEVGKAVVEPAPGADPEPFELAALETFLADRLARYEIPKSLTFVDELPTSGPGKIDRQAVLDAHGGDESV